MDAETLCSCVFRCLSRANRSSAAASASFRGHKSTLTRYETCVILTVLGWRSSVRNVGPNPDSPVEREETQTVAI